MPYSVEQDGERYCVVKDATGERVACHDSRAEANAQVAALYANEGDLSKASRYATEGRRKRRLHKVRIDEVSSVDRPAQEGALDVLFKRAPLDKREFSSDERERLADSGVAMPDGSYPIPDRAALGDAIQAFGRAKNKAAVAAHIKKRARALGATDLLPEDGQLSLSKSLEDETMTDEEKAALQKAEQERDELRKRAERAEKALALPTEQRAHFDTLDAEAQDAFLAKSDDERAGLLKAKADEDPVVYTTASGVPIRKSAGDAVVELAKQADEDRKARIRSDAQLENERLAKRADDELGHYPGESAVKVAVLRAIDGIEDENLRKSARELVAAGENALATAFEKRGTTDAPTGSPEAELESLTKRYMADNPDVSYIDAYDIVAKANPDVYEKALQG